jgi:hypothetical protein
MMTTKQNEIGKITGVKESSHAKQTVYTAQFLPEWVKWSHGQHVISEEVILTFDQIVHYETIRRTSRVGKREERSVHPFTENRGTSTLRIPASSVVHYLKEVEKGSRPKTMCVIANVYTDTGQRVQLAFDATSNGGITSRITRYTS